LAFAFCTLPFALFHLATGRQERDGKQDEGKRQSAKGKNRCGAVRRKWVRCRFSLATGTIVCSTLHLKLGLYYTPVA
jgi:hypothetical protein